MKKKIRVLIADDEALGRKEMRRLLKAHPEVEIVAEAEDGDDAVELIQKHAPELVFLDIRMPGRDGFGVLDALEPPLPEIVFSTAYDQFAVDAVRRGALDYLLKPVAPEDLARAIQKAAERINLKGPAIRKDGRLRATDRIFVQEGQTSMFFEVGSIRVLESEGNYTRIRTAQAHGLVRRPIKYFEVRLDPGEFFRANRAQMVNLKVIKECKPIEGGRLTAQLEEGTPIEISRRQARAFRELLRI
jgi:two-component system LytT family response regulator